MQAEIIEIAHEILEHRFLVHHGPPRAPLEPAPWRAGDEEVRPIVLVAGQPTSLRVRLALAPGAASGSYRLEARLGEAPLFTGHMDGDVARAGAAGASTAGPRLLDTDLHLARVPAAFAALRGADLTWQLVEDAPDGARHALPAPPLQIFWLPAGAAQVLARGVPIELLHTLADALDEGGQRLLGFTDEAHELATRAPDSVVAGMVRRIFYRGVPAYDSCGGMNYYTSIPRRGGSLDFDCVTLLLFWYLYLPAWPCNCYDVAAVLQLYLSVAGVPRVAYCYMGPFGYLARTELIGIGQTNNPFFKKYRTERIVPERDRERSAFGNHAFCVVDGDGIAGGAVIADACAGPHPGNESPLAYVACATDSVFPDPPRVPRGTVGDITRHKGVVHADMIVSGSASRAAPAVRAFIERVGYQEPADARAVACAWPDPLGGLDPGWRVVGEEIIPGEHEVLRRWSASPGGAHVTIDLYVARDGATAQERFLAIGSTHSSPGPIFDPVPGWPGHGAAVFRHPDQQQLVWLHHNVVCDIRAMHASFDVEDLARWLLGYAEAAVTDDLALHRPHPAPSVVSRPVLRVGQRTRIDVDVDTGHLAESIGAPAGLRLIGRGQDWFELVGTAPATDTLVIVVIDPRTLLHHAETITIVVSA